MIYSEIRTAEFIKRPNRFIAHVLLDGKEEIVHVKNTGRCKEILVPGTKVILEKGKNMNRKTAYSLIAAYKGETLINIDSQAPNLVVFEHLQKEELEEIGAITSLKREVTFLKSRFDISYQQGSKEGFIEVKGVTLENEGVALFPDAPTLRGRKHIYELIEAQKQGYLASIFFLVQLRGVKYFKPNTATDPEFGQALVEAQKAGVNLLCYDCTVEENMLKLHKKVDILLGEC